MLVIFVFGLLLEHEYILDLNTVTENASEVWWDLLQQKDPGLQLG